MGAAAHDSRSGELLNKSYELHELIEAGGVADTYRATDRKRSRPVKVTLLRPEFALQSGVVQAFLSLPKTLTGLRHPNVSQVIAVESDETGIPFVVEELVEGEPLARTIAAFPDGMPLGVAMNVVMPVIEAMAAAHKLGLVHGQLDHEHVLLTKSGGTSVPKIVRFGAAALRAKQVQKDGMQRTAPELRAGKGGADARSDVWALGALLYETLCGEAPAGNPGQHVPLDERAPHLPTELVQLVERCLAAEPGRRPKQAEEVRVALALARERLRAGSSPSQVEPRIGKAAGAVQAEPRPRNTVNHDPRGASAPSRATPPRATPPRATPPRATPPRVPAPFEQGDRPTAKVPGLSELARAHASRRSSAPPLAARAGTPTAFAPEAEITFAAEPAVEAEISFGAAFDPFAAPAAPSRAPPRSTGPAQPAKSAKLPATSAPSRSVGRKTAAGREVALPSLDEQQADAGLDDAFAATFEDAQFAPSDTTPGNPATSAAAPAHAATGDADFDRGFEATFDDAFGAAPDRAPASEPDVELDLMPPPLPPPPARHDAAAARAFGLGATMIQPAPKVAPPAPSKDGFDVDLDFGLAAPTMADDDEPEMTLEPARSLPAPPVSRPPRASAPAEVKTMSDLADAFGPIGGDAQGAPAETVAARGREKRPAKKREKEQDKPKDPARKSVAGDRPARASSEQRARPAPPVGSPKQLRQANTGAKLSEDQARTLRARVQSGERRRWRVFGGLLMLLFCFSLIFFIPLLYDPTHTKAQQRFGPNLKIALAGLMIVSISALVRTWVVQLQSKPMLMKPVTLTMKVVVLCVCLLAMTFFLPAGALGPAEVAARAALPWASSGFYLFLGIYGLMLGMRESASNLIYGILLILMYGAGFGGAYRALLETVLVKSAAAAHGNKLAGNAASTAETLHNYATGNVKVPDAGASAPMQQQHEVGASEEEDMRSIEQLKNGRKDKGAQFDELHKNMQKMVR